MQQAKTEKSFRKQAAYYFSICAVSFLLIFSRRPDAILNPQFWAEDGKIWFAESYNHGALYSLLKAEAGYYQTISRLVAIFSQHFAFEYTPLIFNLFAVFVKILVVFFLVSSRFSKVVPNVKIRILVAFIYLALPHSFEVHVNLTNVQWHLAFLSCLIVAAEPDSHRKWKIFDSIVLIISSLSGPFCLLIAPLAALKFWRRRDQWTLYLLGILLLGCFVQAFGLLTNPRPSTVELGATVKLFLKIVGGQIFVSSIVGERGYIWTLEHSFWKDGIAVLVNLTGFSLVVYGFLKAPDALRILILFSVLIVCGALLSPAVTAEFPQWQALWFAGVGTRYWFIPIFCFLVLLIFLAFRAEKKFVRATAAALLFFASLGMIADWRYPPFADLNFPAHAAEFESAPAGSEVSIPINPPPHWEMKLIKKSEK